MFTPKEFNVRKLEGISETTIAEHIKLYQGYVKNANGALAKIAEFKGDESKVYELGEMYRRFSFEYNGMRNHEVYFTLLSGTATALDESSVLSTKIVSQWGSVEAWAAEFQALALTRGIGWAMLSLDLESGTLLNHWVDEQHLGQLQNTKVIVALDMWEHSYVADYLPSGKKSYVADFMKQLDWSFASARLS